MSDKFNFAIPPFDRLTTDERAKLQAGIDLAYFPKDETVLATGALADSLYVIVKGVVQERRGTEVIVVHGVGDTFDVKSVFEAAPANAFVASEDSLVQLVPKGLLVDLMRSNPAFGDFYFQDVCEKIRAAAQMLSSREMASLMMARIRQAYIQPAVFVDGTTSARDAAVLMKQRHAGALLVRDAASGTQRLGILTGTDLRESVIVEGLPVTAPVAGMAHYELLTVSPDDLMFSALVLMTRHSVSRLVVRTDEAIVGVLEQVDVLGFLSNHSQLIAAQVDRAASIDDLLKAGGDVVGLIRALHSTGVKVRFIAELVTELNRKVFRKLFDLLAPPDLVANSCLIVMGSEGRAEQILKTDQDNGLILRDGYTCPELARITDQFTQTLIRMGYPPCDGNIMVRNPEWTKSVHDYCDTIHRWIHHPDEASQLNLAIFYDAAPVAGDFGLLDQVKGYLMDRMGDNKMFFAHFARPTLNFDTPVGLFATLFADRGARHQIDIKKAGIFPIVHGVRSLAIELRMSITNTYDRIWALESVGLIDRPFATELSETLEFMSVLRLQAHIDKAEGTQSDNFVHPDEMSKLERDQLKDCLHTVKKFKEFITYHFKLNMF
ncbi:MAG TPA: putative nucleotidyltransferase substrate binding domain-containing protein [Azospirillaceae bacterium]|nr:putative nucleotidyltransferase substrate binding domain-containing protein [Azospirillaceae bacterium]